MRVTEALPDLPPAVARQTLQSLIGALPSPATAAPEDRAARDEAAIAAVAALHPADAYEAILATQIVAANAHALDCLRRAVQPGLDEAAVHRCRAQAGSMMRHMQSGLRMLRRDQAAREKAEAAMQPAAMARAGYWFRDVTAPEPARREAEPPADSAADAELHAAVHSLRAARIRAQGALAEKPEFRPPSPEMADAIGKGAGPMLRALDAPGSDANAASG
jgi:hypothetical protein